MSDNDRGETGQVDFLITTPDDYQFVSDDENSQINTIGAGDFRTISHPDILNTLFRPDDILVITDILPYEADNPTILKVRFISYLDDDGNEVIYATEKMKVTMLTIQGPYTWDDLVATITQWSVRLQQRKPLFEFKFPRFAYRYKYENGEYSTFSPWSELAFLPGRFDYESTRAHNLGMINTIRSLKIKNFIPIAGHRPIDVTCVDILYKEANKPNVYVVKSIHRGIDAEWELFTPKPGFIDWDENSDMQGVIDAGLTGTYDYSDLLPSEMPDGFKTGELIITSEMIHVALPSNQTLRVWDNVPRVAASQEIIANRLVYANYTQGYDIPFPTSLKHSLISKELNVNDPAKKSVKSLRYYKWGMVFGDDYGRETPVVTSGVTIGDETKYESMTSGQYVDKELSSTSNKFELTQDWSNPAVTDGEPPDYFNYVKYYVKETSNEYYNLILDRWYFASDKNDQEVYSTLWLSFPSADRNKVDEETYLILKKKHGENTPTNQSDKVPRYKIIAIENEAPDFIKTEHRDIGDKRLLSGDSAQSWTTENLDGTTFDTVWPQASSDPEAIAPLNLMEKKFFSMTLDGFNALFGFKRNTNSAGRVFEASAMVGKLRARIVGVDSNQVSRIMYSRWNTVTKYYMDSQASITFNFENQWGDEVDMLTRFINTYGDPAVDTSYSGLVYKIEFKEEVVTNKPEFDGRFFVKVESDEVLDSEVMVNDPEETKYATINSMAIAQVATQKKNPGKESDGSNYGEDSPDASNSWWFGAFNNPTPLDEYSYGGTDLQDGGSNGPLDYTPWDDSYAYNDNTLANSVDESAITAGIFTGVGSISEIGDDGNNPFNPASGNADFNGTGNQMNFFPGNVTEGFATAAWRHVTRSYWQSYSYSRRNVFFIDSARCYNLTIGGNNYNNSRPTGLDEGTIPTNISGDGGTNLEATPTAGHLGRICFATAIKGISDLNDTGKDFYNYMTETGGLFRFKDDPSGHIYKVLTTEVYDDSRNYGYIKDPDSANDSYRTAKKTDVDSDASRRYGVRVNFRRINQSNGKATNDGLEPTVFDPRSRMKHDGSETILIEFVKKITSGGEAAVFTEKGACFETEPKEDLDIDLYYEASKALPLRIKDNNWNNFMPINSSVEVTRVVDKGETQVDLNYVNLTNHKVGNVIMRPFFDINTLISTYCPIVNVISKNSSGVYGDHDENIAVNDFIKFTHEDGTVTKSKVLGFVEKSNNFQVGGGGGGNELNAEWPTFSQSSTSPVDIQVKWNTFAGTYLIDAINPGNYNLITNQASIGSQITATNSTLDFPSSTITDLDGPYTFTDIEVDNTADITTWVDGLVDPTPGTTIVIDTDGSLTGTIGKIFSVELEVVIGNQTGWYAVDPEVWKYPVKLPWYNCWSFGNGVESDRIRDDFNAPRLDNGVVASTSSMAYQEETIKNGLIHSDIYNSTSGINNLNQFNMAEKITKELNPSYGAIQALKTRYDGLIVFSEDKVLKILANKDAVYNADNNPQLVATNRVLGTATPYVGDYGISKNPESLAWDQFRMYFTDMQRGAVLRLSQDGLTPISNAGMKEWFREKLTTKEYESGTYSSNFVGTFDTVNGEYNLTLNYSKPNSTKYTISFNEATKGWVSFKSFMAETGKSVSGKYFTAINGNNIMGSGVTGTLIWEHYANTTRNNFYGVQGESKISVLFNDEPGLVKSFQAVNYEGSQSRVIQNNPSDITDAAGNSLTNVGDGEYYNLASKNGWYIESISTDLDRGHVPEFINKEGKWFNKINGIFDATSNTSFLNDSDDSTTQGLGIPTAISSIYY